MKFLSFPLLFGLFLSGCNSIKIPEKPNFLFIAVDDLRPELNCYGANWIHSPNIDKLSATGIRFNFAYCQVPVCGASRASLLTGLRPSKTRFITYDTWAEKDAPQAVSLPGYLKGNGYYTLSNGKVFHHRMDMSASWSEEPWHPEMDVKGPRIWRNYRKPEHIEFALNNNMSGPAFEKIEGDDTLYFDGQIAEKSLRDLERLAKNGQPFFLAVGFLKPHLPFNAPAKYWDNYQDKNIRLARNPQPPLNAPVASLHNWGELRAYSGIPKEGPLPDSIVRKLVHGYYACVSYTDAQIGKLLNKLRELNLDKNTVIILWGDHGWNLGEHGLWCKHCNFETSLRAPLILEVPWMEGGKYTNALVEFIDIYPTLCQLAGIPVPEHIMGESLLPFFDRPELPGKEFVFSRFHDGESVKNGDYRYTEWLDEDNNRYAEMLYDHKKDEEENVNIAVHPDNLQIIEKFQKSNLQFRVNLQN